MSKRKILKKIALGTLLSSAIGLIYGSLKTTKSDKNIKIDEEIQNKIKVLYAELVELITTVEEEFKGNRLLDSKKMSETIDEAHLSKQKLNQIIQAIKTGKSDNKELNLAIKEAEKAINSAKNFLLSK